MAETGPATSPATETERGPWLPKIRMFHHNCAMSNEWTIAAQDMGVEHKADVVYLEEAPIERGGIGISHWAYELRKRYRVSIAIWTGCCLVIDEQTDLCSGANENVITTDVRRRGERIMRILNV
jgi:hypothetical protein